VKSRRRAYVRSVQDEPQTPWHEDPAFWTALKDGIFDPQAWHMAEQEVEALSRLTGLRAGAVVLDIPCGPGRHLLPLARRGYRVCGVDLNRSYLEEARRRIDRAKLDVELVQADMREFERPSSFDLAVNLYTSFGYSNDPGDDLRMLKRWRRCLRPGGQLVLELVTQETARAGEAVVHHLEGARTIIEQAALSADRSVIERRWTVQTADLQRTWTAWHRLYDMARLRALVESAEFRDLRSFGGLDGRELEAAEDCAVLLAVA
jgi:SAM-dependent methyltransferase